MLSPNHTAAEPMAERLHALLGSGDAAGLEALATAEPLDDRDAWLSLLAIHDLHLAPVDVADDRVRWQHHPAVAGLKGRLEERYLARLSALDDGAVWDLPAEAPAAMRALGALGLVPPAYRWLAAEAQLDELIDFLALEGGPDGGFDDLVAVCQLGLHGEPKLEMARNYWDEMGRGNMPEVHTELHRRLSAAVDLPQIAREDQPVEALERSLLGSVLATNRWLQPEMVGALGLLELQAGPRCRQVVGAMCRLGVGDDGLAFYVEHAQADPRHGKDWVDNVVTPLAEEPGWGERIVRGARWRSLMNGRFFDMLGARFLREPDALQRAS